jgi:hypothetical protein
MASAGREIVAGDGACPKLTLSIRPPETVTSEGPRIDVPSNNFGAAMVKGGRVW